jgi:hypothetical protein
MIITLTFPAGQGRDPFPFITGDAATEDVTGDWLWLADALSHWEFGDKTDYPGKVLLIRDVSRHMMNFIIKHFEESLVSAANTVLSPELKSNQCRRRRRSRTCQRLSSKSSTAPRLRRARAPNLHLRRMIQKTNTPLPVRESVLSSQRLNLTVGQHSGAISQHLA